MGRRRPVLWAAGGCAGYPVLAVPAGAQQPPAQAGGELPGKAMLQIQELLDAKEARTPAQRKVISQLLDAARQQSEPSVSVRQEAADTDPVAEPESVTVDIRADVTPAVLARIRALGGTLVNSVAKYQTIRTRLPLAALEPLATLEAVQFIRPADQPIIQGVLERSAGVRAAVVPDKVDTSEGDVAHRANMARTTYGVDGTGIGIGVISDGVETLADQQATGDVPARVMVLPGQEGGSISLGCGRRSSGTEGTAILEIVHDLAPGAELFFADGGGGPAQMAQNIEDLCAAGADIIVDDIGYLRASAFQDDVISQAISAAAANGCFYFSSAGNAGNLNDGTAGVWEGDFATGGMLSLNGIGSGAVVHDFGGGVTGNRIKTNSTRPIILQWADPVDGSANDYDLFLIDEDDNVLASSTNTQDGTQDSIEYIGGSCAGDRKDARLVIVKNSGAADRYVRLNYARGGLEIATAGQTFGHSASQNAIGVAAVDVGDAGGAGGVFNGTESVETFSSDGPRRIFFEADGTPITPGNFSSTGGRVLQKPDLAAADGVSTSTPGYSTFHGTSAAAPHAAAIAALMLEAAGGPGKVTPAALRTAMTGAGAVLDIEATGVDRDSGAGIVMAPGAVDAVDVAVADRNRAPTVSGTLDNRTMIRGAAAVTIDVASVFSDPDQNDTLTYTALSSDPDRLDISLTGSMLTLTPRLPGLVVATVRATDSSGLSVVLSFLVAVALGNRDYDVDDDNLIDVGSLAQLDAVRYDLNGDGVVDDASEWQSYYDAFDQSSLMGCPDGCAGFELADDLDFDTNLNGIADSGDDYWNGGDGWVPIGGDATSFYVPGNPFIAVFEGNGHTISNLYIETDTDIPAALFGSTEGGSSIRNVGLIDVDVTGTEFAAGLVGWNAGEIRASYATGRVSAIESAGGFVAINGSGGGIRASYATSSVSGVKNVGGLVGFNYLSGEIHTSYATGRVSGVENVGGLVGFNYLSREVTASYATGRVSGVKNVGGLVGFNYLSREITASYATGRVSGVKNVGGLVGFNYLSREITASYATGRVSGVENVGGLVGFNYLSREITASYATGRVSGVENVGGLVGFNYLSREITASYWDTSMSGHTSGSFGVGKTTSQLQSPTSYSGIYGSWNVDINEDNMNDEPWDFGTSSQYPALKADMDGDDDATWEEFGYQIRSGPTLTATATTNAGQSQVELEWTEVSLSSEWTPAPSVSYTVTRDDGNTIETIAENLTVREYTDTDVAGETYVYQAVAVVDGGEAVRSAAVSVTVAGNKRPVAVGALSNRWVLVGDSAMTELGGAFQDPEGDAITYGVSSSDTTVAQVTLSGTRVTISPVAEGATTTTVTATDDGSNQSRTQQFTVTVLPATTVDYDTDDDGLIEISSLGQLYAVRYDLDGNGIPNAGSLLFGKLFYASDFPNGGSYSMACGGLLGCVGYELNADLDFDTDRSGKADAGDAYWNNGAGWAPIGNSSGSFSSFGAIFEGNGRTIANLFIDSSENDIGLFGATRSSAVIRNLEMVSVQVTGTDNVGGLVGSNGGAVSGCYATGKVSGDDDVGGLVGANLDDGAVSASYSTVQVTGDDRIGGLAGSNGGEVTAAYATGRVMGDSETGGLIGGNTGDVNISYATGLVSGRSTVGGLVGRNSGGGAITDSYWDSDTSGRTAGSYGQSKNTAELQLPTAASDIYLNWNVDLDGDGMNDAPWEFGTSGQYPVLSMDTNGVGGATWQEFGQQIRTSPALMTTTALGQVTLTWSAVSSAAYNLYRTSGTTVEIISESTSSRTYVDTDVTAGATYVYQVAAVINGGEASRSPQDSVVVPTPGMLPTVTLELMPASVSENSGTSTVTARLSLASSATTTVTVSATAVSPAVGGDFTLSMNTTLTITAGQTSSTGTVTIAANDNTVDTPGKTVRVSGTASNSARVTGPSDVTLTIIDEDDPPTVTLELMPTSIDENGGSTTVTARLNRTSSETTTVTISAMAVSPAVSGDFRLSSNKTLTITAGQTTSTGTVTLTANNNDADTPDNTVRVSGTARNRHGVTNPDDEDLTITDDDDPPTVTLRLSRTSINENGGSATVTARLDRTSSETTTVTVSATALSPAVAGDFALSENKTLTITAGQTTSTGTVTLTANNNDADTPDNTVRVSGAADNSHGVTDPDDEDLTITDDDDPPTVMLRLSRTSIGENSGSTTVTARLDRKSSETTTVTVSATAVSPAVADDFTLSANKTLTITAGQTTRSLSD